MACINDQSDSALRTHGKYVYVAPTYKQAKAVAWDYLRNIGRVLTPLGAKIHESELRVDFRDGGQVRLFGADNYEALRGLHVNGAVLDEYADFHPSVFPEIIRPALTQKQGSAIFIGTPKGQNAFYKTHRLSLGYDDKGKFDQSVKDQWFSLTLRASETGLISPEELASARQTSSQEQYDREYECSFEAPIRGAYFGKLLAEAQKQGRIGKVAADPLLPLRAYADIGGSGANADAFVFWIVQFVGQEIRVLDYYESVGQVLGEHLNWLRQHGYENAVIRLPHDGVNENNILGKRYEEHIRDAGFKCDPSVPNQGRGAASLRVESVRRIFPKLWFNESTTEGGRLALAQYHERWDEERNIGLGPEHDWSSHCADAFGLMAICYEEPSRQKAFGRKLEYRSLATA